MKWLHLYFVRGTTVGADGTGSRWESNARYKDRAAAQRELDQRLESGATSGKIMTESFRLHEYPAQPEKSC